MHFIVSVKLVFHSVFQYVSRLAVQFFADSLQSGEAYALCLSVLEHRHVRGGYADRFSELAYRNLPAGKHHVYVDNY